MRVDALAQHVRCVGPNEDVRFANTCAFAPNQENIPDPPAEDATAGPAPVCGEYQRTPARSKAAAGDATSVKQRLKMTS